jgi:hypothetical protein
MKVFLILIVLIPASFFIRSVLEDNESQRIESCPSYVASNMRSVISAEVTYETNHGRYGSLEELASANLIDPEFGEKHGYSCKVIFWKDSFVLTAVPIKYGKGFPYNHTGLESVFWSESSDFRAADKQGAEAGANDPPLKWASR